MLKKINRAYLLLISGFFVVALAQLWLYTSGYMFSKNFLQEPAYSSRFVDLANSFSQGKLTLPDVPDAKLLALPDPYDHLANSDCRAFDMSFYKGNYYLYFGPLPSLILILLRCLGIHSLINDSPFMLFFSWGHLLFFTLALRAACARCFPGRSLTIANLVGLSSGLMATVTFSLNRPAFYEVAPAGGTCFMWCGLWLLFSLPVEAPLDGLRAELSRSQSVRIAVQLLAAGFAFACALACRVALLYGIVAVVLWTLWRCRRLALPLLLPLALGVGALGYYNYARFDDPFDFGYNYQLTIFRNDTPNTFAWLHIPANAYVQLFPFPKVSPFFPFVSPKVTEVPSFVPQIEHFWNPDPAVALLWTAPIILLFPLGLCTLRRVPDRRIAISLLLSILSGLPALKYHHPNVRYQLDFCFSILAIATFGLYWLEARRPKATLWLTAAAVVYTMLVGGLMGITAQYDNFKTLNPKLYGELRERYDFSAIFPTWAAKMVEPSPTPQPSPTPEPGVPSPKPALHQGPAKPLHVIQFTGKP